MLLLESPKYLNKIYFTCVRWFKSPTIFLSLQKCDQLHIKSYTTALCSPACDGGLDCVAPNTCRKGVQLMLNGANYPNNSVIQFDSVYYTPDHCHSLLCTTDRVPCCLSQDGNWYLIRSNGSYGNALSNSSESNYYQSRENDGSLRLIRNTQSTDENKFCCQLSDAMLTVQTLCATLGMYDTFFFVQFL